MSSAIPRGIQESGIGQGSSPDFLAGARGIASGKTRCEDKKYAGKADAVPNRFLNHERYICSDRTLFHLSSKIAEPFCSVYEFFRYRLSSRLDPARFDHLPTVSQEIAYRTTRTFGAALAGAASYFYPLPALGSLCLAFASHVGLKRLAIALQKEGFTHVLGKGPEKSLDPQDPKIKIGSINLCGVSGGLSIDHGGVRHWRERIDGLAKKIQSANLDILVLQEVYDTSLAEALIQRLESDYAHFFYHTAPSLLGCSGGVMVLSKYPVHSFEDKVHPNNHWTLKRNFSTLEIKAKPNDEKPCVRIIGTHLHNGYKHKDREIRMNQIAEILASLAKKSLPLPTVLVGDLNIERDQEEGKRLTAFLKHSHVGDAPTCTNELLKKWAPQTDCDWEETIDYISLFKEVPFKGAPLPVLEKGGELENARFIELFDPTFDTKTALSDHHGLSALLKLSKLQV